MLAAEVHLGTKNCDFQMERYVFKRRNDDVPLDEDEGFKHFVRVSNRTFEYICSLVREDLISRLPSGLINIERRLLSVEKQVVIALQRLAPGESQVSVGASFWSWAIDSLPGHLEIHQGNGKTSKAPPQMGSRQSWGRSHLASKHE